MGSDAARFLGLPAGKWCLTTDRLRLAPLTADDAGDLASMTDHRSITDVITFLPVPFTTADALDLIGQQAAGTDLYLGGRIRDGEGTLVVVVGLHFRGDVDLELGYWVHPGHHGQGLAREASEAALSAATDLLPDRHLFAECRPDNQRSWRVLLSLGFVPDGDDRPAHRPGRRRLSWAPSLHAGHNGRRSEEC